MLADAGDAGSPPRAHGRRGGGSGGAGATTFACALGQVAAAARAGRVVVDLDPLGPGLDRVLGSITTTASAGTRCRDHRPARARSLHDAVPRRDGSRRPHVGAGPAGTLQAFAVREALSAAQRGHDLVVVDLPRTVDALFDEVVARCDLLVVVARPTVAGIAATARLRARLTGPGHAAAGARPRRGSAEVEQATGLPRCWAMGEQRGLAEAIDLGLGPVRSRRGAARPRGRRGARPRWRRSRRPPQERRVSAVPAASSMRSAPGWPRSTGTLTPAAGRGGAAGGRAGRSGTRRSWRSTTRCAATSSAPGRSTRCCGCRA